MKKVFLSETIWPRALIFGMQHTQWTSNLGPFGPLVSGPCDLDLWIKF